MRKGSDHEEEATYKVRSVGLFPGLFLSGREGGVPAAGHGVGQVQERVLGSSLIALLPA